MARANLTSKEIAEVMKAISQIISIKSIVKNLDTKILVEVINKFENPIESDKSDKILRGLEDRLDLADSRVAHINMHGGASQNCEVCDD
tara:strand:+ start:3713 stop:3979 length:267 start_codon:yes stop_codon:yes gene_type:complete